MRGLTPWLLAAAMILRSLVAPGYEIANTDHHGGLSLGIVWCPGLNGIRIATQGEPGEYHGHPQQQDAGTGEHFTAACGLWTGNPNFVDNPVPPARGLTSRDPVLEGPDRIDRAPARILLRDHISRAPPA